MHISVVRIFVITLTAGVTLNATDDWDERNARFNYSYFTDEEWNRHQAENTSKTELDILHKHKMKDVNDKLSKMSLSANKYLIPSTEKDELRLVVIGKTGQGKSATANTLLDKVAFKEGYGHKSVTKKAALGTATVDGREIKVYDTPGLQDTDTSNEETLREITRIFSYYDEGVHAFLYVINLGNPRFTKEDSEVLSLLEETFGGNFLNYCILVFTHGNDLVVNLDAYCTHQREVSSEDDGVDGAEPKTEEESVDIKGLAGLINTMAWKITAIDNHLCSPAEGKRHRDGIFAVVDKMTAKNKPPVYTHKFLEEAQKRKEEIRRKALKNGWDPDDMELVEDIIARNPDISKKDLVEEVNKHRKAERRIPEENIRALQKDYNNVFTWMAGKVWDALKWVGSIFG